MFLIRLLCILFVVAGAGAAPVDGPAAYSHLMPVRVSGKQAVVQLRLPRDVYLQSRSRELADLRLFDADGTALPFALVERLTQDTVTRRTAPLAVFAVRAPPGAAKDALDGLQIRTRDDGAVIALTAPLPSRPGDVLSSLVLASAPPGPTGQADATTTVGALSLTPPPGLNNYSARIALDTSDDLQHWAPLTEATVSWLFNPSGARVSKDRIEFAPRAFRYARITWLEGKPVEFAFVSADYLTRSRPPQQWESVVLDPVPGRVAGDLAYVAAPALPVEALGLVFHAQNVVLPATLGQYRQLPGREPGFQGPLDVQSVTSATFYQLTQDGRQRVSGDVEVPPTHAAQWVLRPHARLADRPGLRLLWRPQTIVFVAAGRGPWTLAFGRDGAQSADLPLSHVAPGFSERELAALEQAGVGEAMQQHAWAADAPGSIPSRSVWLWGLLVCGVAALGAMAWRLSRQLKADAAGEPPS